MLKIVIADDDKTIREGIGTIIRSLGRGYEIDSTASDGRAALERVTAWKPDVLITDIKMPVMDGIQLVHTISGMDLPVKMIVLSGYDELQYVKESLKAGVRDYLLKPLNKRDLIKLLDRMESAKAVELLRAEQQEKLKRRVEESRFLRKERLLWDLIVNRVQPSPAFHERVSEFGLDRIPEFVLAIVRIDGAAEEASSDAMAFDWGAWIQALSEEERWLDRSLFSFQNGQLTLLLPSPAGADDSPAADPALLARLTERMRACAAGAYTAGVSRPIPSLSAVPQAYKMAADSLRQAFYDGPGGVHVFDSRRTVFAPVLDSQWAAPVQQIVQAVEALDAAKAREHLDSLLCACIGQRSDPAQLAGECSKLVRKLYARFEEAERIGEGDPERSLLRMIETAPTASLLRERLCEDLHRLVLEMQADRAKKDSPVIASAKEYIRRNYQQQMNLQTVAAQVNLNPNYFSNYFKQETGMNFLEYLLDVRIQAAKKLLEEPDVKVYEVGYLVGYDNPSSFNRAFKNVTGVTPSDYRKKVP
ncbi:response regulator [Paenibacillus sp. S-38]|uniref:response regulator n=1 Tax=Paenibacillus sp. S-38 TaxID=3416710 RepID=UPI003CF9FF7E